MLYSHSGCGVCTGRFALDVTVLNHMLAHRVGLVVRFFKGLRYVHYSANTRPQPVGQRSLYTIWICRATSAMLDISMLESRQTAFADLTLRPLVGTA